MGGERVIAIANFGELFEDPDAPASVLGEADGVPLGHAAGHKAGWWPEEDGFLLIAPTSLDLPPVPAGIRKEPAERLVVPDADGRTAARLLEDARLWSRVRRFVQEARRVRLLATVNSAGLRRMADRLATAAGLEVVGVPDCPPGLVRYWNTKIGGRDLLRGVPAAAALVPDAVVCHTPLHAEAMLAGHPASERYVLKANMGAGGSGILWVTGGETGLAARLTRPDHTTGAGKNGLWPLPLDEPLLLEVGIGDPRRNRSLTADFTVMPGGTVAFEGAALQVLDDFTRYRGIAWSPGAVAPAVLASVASVGTAVGRAMARRGFSGPFNLDFILPPEGRLALAEINVRRSAPLDQHLAMRRLFGPDWPDRVAMRSWECLAGADPTTVAAAGLAFDGRAGVLLLGPRYGNGSATMAVAPDAAGLDRLVASCHDLKP
ncbi:hypothetical protein [Azospirillum lipoferum]|nr:hypothetical protein [Azospirillum lipoferum]